MQKPDLEEKKINLNRRRTDESLLNERTRTNVSITESRAETEKQTDSNIEQKRDAADRKTSKARTSTDSDLAAKTDGTHHSLLQKERQTSDIKIKLERTQADAFIESERDQANTITIEILDKERKQTDKNLKTERAQNDDESSQILEKLSDEVKEHDKTKFSVTTRDELITILSHDLRNPIGAISTSAELIAEQTTEPTLVQMVELIKRNANIALQLIQDIFEMESIAQGKFELHIEKQNLYQLLQESVESFQHAAAEKKISLELTPVDSIVEIPFDRVRIWQVISNLLGNAVKFTPSGGSIKVSLELNSDEAVIAIRDNGIGIPAEKLNIIFNRFSQIASKNRTGLGLGLYISKIFVEAHKGRIWVDSSPGQGSTFYISLKKIT